MKKGMILFAAAAEFVEGGETDIAEGAAGNRCSVIVKDHLEHVGIVAYLRAVLESIGAATAAAPQAVADLCSYEELFAGIETGADEDGHLAERGVLTAEATAKII